MTFDEFTSIVEASPDGVVLLEGRRAIPERDARLARKLAVQLARRFPALRFRSGNAEGADQAFSEGVARVDAGRLQVVAPYASHRIRFRFVNATYDSPESLPEARTCELAEKAALASPKNRWLVTAGRKTDKGPFAAKAAYLIRDTMKVTGHSREFPKPVCALFYTDPDDPMTGGTGHTIRVCRMEGVPCVFQDEWQEWIHV